VPAYEVLNLILGCRAGAGILPYPETKGHDLQINTFKYYWALAHRDPTSGVQVCG
jgi:hypothetical protein